MQAERAVWSLQAVLELSKRASPPQRMAFDWQSCPDDQLGDDSCAVTHKEALVRPLSHLYKACCDLHREPAVAGMQGPQWACTDSCLHSCHSTTPATPLLPVSLLAWLLCAQGAHQAQPTASGEQPAAGGSGAPLSPSSTGNKGAMAAVAPDGSAEACALSKALAAVRERCERAEAALDALSQQLLQVPATAMSCESREWSHTACGAEHCPSCLYHPRPL